MISKRVPPLSGLTNLIMAIGGTKDGVTWSLLLVIIFIDKKLGGSYLKGKQFDMCVAPNW